MPKHPSTETRALVEAIAADHHTKGVRYMEIIASDYPAGCRITGDGIPGDGVDMHTYAASHFLAAHVLRKYLADLRREG